MIGFIGVGYMGSRIATRLIESGRPVGVYDRTPAKAQALAEHGARVYDSPTKLARDADNLLTMLADDAAVEEVMLGASGIVAAALPGTTIIDLSSVHPDTSRAVAAAAIRRGVTALDAAVSGSTPQAESGNLVVFVGGDHAAYERCLPIFQVMGQSIFYLGPNGAGATMKLVANALLGAGMQALAEALALGQRGGLDRGVLMDVLEQTTVLTPGQKAKLEYIHNNGEVPVQFPLRLMWKDLGNVLRLAEQRSVPMPVTAAAQQAYAIEQAKRAEEDFSAVIHTMEELAGVTPSNAPRSGVGMNVGAGAVPLKNGSGSGHRVPED
jgi:3-hydroxyisobutyrate dehydrogenase-like beta-hydroxyacid dehydrogenase